MDTPTIAMDTPKKRPRGKPFSRGTDPRRNLIPPTSAGPIGGTCPQCHSGTLTVKSGPYGDFAGCDAYPRCLYKQKVEATPGTAQYAHVTTVVHTAQSPVAQSPVAQSPVTRPEPMPATPTPTGSIEAAIRAIAEHAAAQSVNEPRVHELLSERLATFDASMMKAVASLMESKLANVQAAAPTAFTVTVNGATPIKLEGIAHPALAQIIRRVSKAADGSRPFKNIQVTGPAGSGKTYLAQQLAAALGMEDKFYCLAAAQDLPSSAMVGRTIPNLTTGEQVYSPSPFALWFEHGGVFLLDEGDNMDASTQLAVNAALDNGHWTRPDGKRITRHVDAVFVLAMNTWGNGQSREYVGRTQLDGAFLDRFVGARLFLNYDEALERALCPEHNIRAAVQDVRVAARKLKLRRIVSTRAILATRKLVQQCGFSVTDALRETLIDWTPEDLSAVGVY